MGIKVVSNASPTILMIITVAVMDTTYVSVSHPDPNLEATIISLIKPKNLLIRVNMAIIAADFAAFLVPLTFLTPDPILKGHNIHKSMYLTFFLKLIIKKHKTVYTSQILIFN
jgi:hypothetical protein